MRTLRPQPPAPSPPPEGEAAGAAGAPGYQGPPAPRPPPAGYSGTTVAATGVAGVLLGTIAGVVIMMVASPAPSPTAPTATASASAPADDAPEPDPSATASATASAAPTVDAAALAYQRRLAELRKKVKATRHRPMDRQCDEYFDGKLPAGYVYAGARFEENAMVAGAAGCQPLARAAKANWFCCFR